MVDFIILKDKIVKIPQKKKTYIQRISTKIPHTSQLKKNHIYSSRQEF